MNITMVNCSIDTAAKESNIDVKTPKTPTPGAWWALMDDLVPCDQQNPYSPTSPMHKENSQWGDDFWSNVLLPTNSDDVSVLSGTVERPSGVKLTRSDAANRLAEMNEKKSKKVETKKVLPVSCNTDSFYLNMMHCSGIEPNTMVRIENNIIEQLDKAESPCKVMSKTTSTAFNAMGEVKDCYVMSSDSEDSGTLDRSKASYATIFEELEEEIPFLRQRSGRSRKSDATVTSKYKDMLHTRSDSPILKCEFDDTAPASENQDNPSEEEEVNRSPSEELVAPLSPKQISSLPNKNDLQKSLVPIADTPSHVSMIETIFLLDEVDTMKNTDETENEIFHSEIPKNESKNALQRETAKQSPATEATKAEADTIDVILSGMSTMTTEEELLSRRLDENRKLLTFHHLEKSFDTDAPKVCMPPAIMKRYNQLKLIRLSRTTSTSDTSKSESVKQQLKYEAIEAYKENEFLYDYESKRHAYIAFFRRGNNASHSIQLYQHLVPKAFPSLERESVVRIEASTVSTTDCLVRKGCVWGENSDNALNLPIVPGVTFAGRVCQLPNYSADAKLRVGDLVISLTREGSNSRHLCIDDENLVKVPASIKDPRVAACLPEVYLTAFQMLHAGQRGSARFRKTSLSGKCILVLGGATALGQAYIELAVAAGCTNVYATGKEKQLSTISKSGGAPLGRDPILWCSALAKKVDLIVGIDTTIGAPELQKDHTQLLKRNGKIALAAGPERACETGNEELRAIDTLAQKLTGNKLSFYNVFDSWEADRKKCTRDLTHLLKLLAEKSLKPKILERISLDQVATAHDLMDGKKLNGFILCEPWIIGKKTEESSSSVVGSQCFSESNTSRTRVSELQAKSRNKACASQGANTGMEMRVSFATQESEI